MKKFVLIPDSFKGTLSSLKICEIMVSSIKKFFPDAKIVQIPVADGGEGSVDCFLSALGGEKVYALVNNPYMQKINAYYGILPDKKTAVIEMASCAGLPLVENNKNPLKTTTFGVGELVLDAISKGVTKIILGLGGSSTNDFGCGMAYALGVRFYDSLGNSFMPVGESLDKVKKIDISNLDNRLSTVEIITMCDIDNPPYGKQGASYVFAPQKGATETDVVLLDNGVKNMCEVYNKDYGVDLSNLKGGGAAGAMGAGMVAFFNSKLQMGINAVLDTVDFIKKIQGADYIFTGEGKIDSQSLRGKVVIGVSRVAKRYGVPVIAIVGGAEGDMQGAYNEGVSAIFTINKLPKDFSVSRYDSEENLQFTMDNLLRILN
jgi:glycerate kinase